MKKLMILSLTLFLTVILTACSSSDEEKPSKEKVEKGSYSLVYYEILNNGFKDYPRVDIAYEDNSGEVQNKSISSSKLYEHVLKDPNEKPKVVVDGEKYHVYRQPYMIYNQKDIEGTVESKEEVEK